MYISLLVVLYYAVHYILINALPYYDKTAPVIVTVIVIVMVISPLQG